MVDIVEEGYLYLDIVVNTRVLGLGFSWQGSDERRARGGIEFPTPLEGEGIIYIHNGDNSTFTIKKGTILRLIMF